MKDEIPAWLSYADENLAVDELSLVNDLLNACLRTRCFNEAIAKDRRVDFHHLSFDPITLKDRNHKNHTFHFQTRLLGDHEIPCGCRCG